MNPYGRSYGDSAPLPSSIANPATMGDIFSDAANAVYGAASSVVQAIPGLRDVVNGPLAALVNGPLKDFANTSIGQWTLRAVATYFTGGLATVVGPQIATMAFALPGVLKGDDFEHAWYDEFSGRCQQLLGMAGQGGTPPATLASETSTGAHTLAENFPNGQATWNLRDLANNAQIRDEAAAWALSFYNHTSLPDLTKFDAQGHYMLPISTTLARNVESAATSLSLIRTTAAAAAKPQMVFSGAKAMNNAVALANIAASDHPLSPYARAVSVTTSTAFRTAAAAAKPVAKPIVKATGGPVTAKSSTSPLLIGGLAVAALAVAYVATRKKKR